MAGPPSKPYFPPGLRAAGILEFAGVASGIWGLIFFSMFAMKHAGLPAGWWELEMVDFAAVVIRLAAAFAFVDMLEFRPRGRNAMLLLCLCAIGVAVLDLHRHAYVFREEGILNELGDYANIEWLVTAVQVKSFLLLPTRILYNLGLFCILARRPARNVFAQSPSDPLPSIDPVAAG